MKNTADLTQTQSKIVDAVNSLPQKHRKMIVLQDFDGLSVAQIAFTLNLSQVTVQKKLGKARLCLQQKLLKFI